jgi:transmembrane sensor
MEERVNAKRDEALAAEAAHWAERIDITDPAEVAQFEEWLGRSPAHVRELLIAKGWDDSLTSDLAKWPGDVRAILSSSENVVRVAPDPGQRAKLEESPSESRRPWFVATLASVALIVVTGLWLWQSLWSLPVYSTAIGEQRTVALDDGSVVSLNTDSRVRISYTRNARTIYLDSGQAMMSVAHDKARPFRVDVGDAVVQALGTKFDVRRRLDRTTVAVVEGHVNVTSTGRSNGVRSQNGEPASLLAGQGLSIVDGNVSAPAPVDLSSVTAWQQRQLVFQNATLSSIAEEFNRYIPTKLRVEAPRLAEQTFSGVWDADRPEVLLEYLHKHLGARIIRDGDELVIRSGTP